MNADYLRNEIIKNRYNYEAHVNYITTLCSSGDIKELEDARQKFHKIYCLSADQWELWLDDLRKGPDSDTIEKKNVMKMLNREAVTEHPVSVKLWFRLLQDLVEDFRECQAFDDTPLSTESEINSLFKQALEVAGWHLTEGHVLWSLFRNFLEISLKDTARDNAISDTFSRQLKIPHSELESTYQSYTEFQSKISSDSKLHSSMRAAYEKSTQLWHERKKYEEQLVATSEAWEVIVSYLDYEKRTKHSDKFYLLRALYERIVESHLFTLEVWIDYLTYMDVDVAVPLLNVELYRRAVKCIPWSSTLWTGYLRSLERSQLEELQSNIPSTVQHALKIINDIGSANVYDYVAIQLTFLEYLYRKSHSSTQAVELFRKSIEDAIRYIDHLFPITSDPSCTLERFWANVEAIKFKNFAKTEDLFDGIIIKRRCFDSDVWLEYINLQRFYGNVQKALVLYKKACAVHVDNSEKLFEHYLMFTREEGTLEDYYKAYGRIQQRRRHIYEVQLKQQHPPKTKTEDAMHADRVKILEKFEKKGLNEETKESKRKLDFQDDEIPSVEKRSKLDESTNEKSRIVFVSNLDYSLREHQLENVFKMFGEIERIDFAYDLHSKQFKGFGHVLFKDENSVAVALSNDRIHIDGRPVFISPFRLKDDSARKTEFKPEIKNESTVFVSNLPKNISEDEIRSCFEKYGEIDGIHIVLAKNDKPRGLAYIKFKLVDEALASLQANGSELQHLNLHVVISAVPFDKVAAGPVKLSENKAGKEIALNQLKPRQIMRPRVPKLGNFNAIDSENSAESDRKSSVKSNEEFRKLFMQ